MATRYQVAISYRPEKLAINRINYMLGPKHGLHVEAQI